MRQGAVSSLTGVQDDDVLLAVAVQAADEGLHLIRREVGGVEGEILVAVHVVDVGPHDLQGDTSSGVAGDDGLQIRHILVAVPALVEPCRSGLKKKGLPLKPPAKGRGRGRGERGGGGEGERTHSPKDQSGIAAGRPTSSVYWSITATGDGPAKKYRSSTPPMTL